MLDDPRYYVRQRKRWLFAQKAEETGYRKRPEVYSWESQEAWEANIKERMGIDFSYFSGRSVLEVGCGCYGLIHWLDDRPRRKVGIDPLLNNYRDVLAGRKSTPELHAAGGEELPFEDATFDIVITINVLDHTCLPQKCVEEMHRVLAPGGELFLESCTFGLHTLIRNKLQIIDPPHPWHFSASEVSGMIERAGFKLLSQDTQKQRFGQIKFHFPPDRHMLKMVGAYFLQLESFYCHAIKQ